MFSIWPLSLDVSCGVISLFLFKEGFRARWGVCRSRGSAPGPSALQPSKAGPLPYMPSSGIFGARASALAPRVVPDQGDLLYFVWQTSLPEGGRGFHAPPPGRSRGMLPAHSTPSPTSHAGLMCRESEAARAQRPGESACMGAIQIHRRRPQRKGAV